MLKNRRFFQTFFFLTVVLIAGGIFYLPEVADEIGWYNSSEFSIAALTSDVPHAPGYPLFTRMASLALNFFPGSFPGDTPAFRLNLLTCFIGIAGAMMLVLMLLTAGISGPVALLGGLFLLTMPEYRNQSVLAEVYGLEICLIALGMLIGLLLEKGWRGNALAFAAGMVGALGVGHRPTFGLYALTLVYFFKQSPEKKMPEKQFWFYMFLGILSGLLPSIDLFFRLQNPARVLLDPLMGQGLAGFLEVFTGTIYSGGMFVFSPGEILVRFLHLLRQVVLDSGAWMLIGPLYMMTVSGSQSRALVNALSTVLAINLLFVLNYNAFEAHTMLMPAYFSLAALASMAVDRIRIPRVRHMASVAAGSVAIYFFFLHPYTVDSPRSYIIKAFSSLPANSMVLMSNDVEFKPFWYYRLVEGFRKDISIQLVDRFESAELLSLKPAVSRKLLYGSLVYPHDSLAMLTASYTVVAENYLHKILPDPGWQQTNSLELPPVEKSLTVNQGLSFWSSGNSEPKTGDAFNYTYSLACASSTFEKIAVATILVDGGGQTIGSYGIMTGHDLHFPGRYFCRDGRPEAAIYQVQRSIVLPESLPAGRYRILMFAFLADEFWPAAWLDFMPDNVSLFNLDGFLEVFALRNGLACRPLIKSMTIEDLLRGSGLKPLFSAPVLLTEFSLQP